MKTQPMRKWLLLVLFSLLPFLGILSPFMPLVGHDAIFFLAFLGLVFLFFNLARWEKRGRRLCRITPLTLGLLAFYTWSVLGIFYSVRLDISYLLIVKQLGGIALLLGLILYLREESQGVDVIWVLTLGAAGHFMISLILQWQNPYEYLPWGSLFPNHNYTGNYFLMPLALAWYLQENEPERWKKLLAGGIFVLIFLNLLFIASRAALGLALLETAAIAVYIKFRSGNRPVLRLIAAVGLALLLFLAINGYLQFARKTVGVAPSINQVYLVNKGSVSPTIERRVMFWEGAWKIFEDHWITGAGPSTYSLLYPVYGSPEKHHPYLPKHAHSLFLQTAADSGIIGLVLLLTFLVLLYSRIVRILRQRGHPAREPVFYLAVGITGFLAHNLVEDTLPLTLTVFNLTLWVGLIDFLDRGYSDVRESSLLNARWVFPAAVAFYGAVCTMGIVDFYFYNRANYNAARHGGQIGRVAVHTGRAKRWCPRCDYPHLIMAEGLVLEYKRTGKAGLLDRAEKELRQAERLGAYNSEAQIQLAEVRILQGRLDDALAAYDTLFKYGGRKEEAVRGLDRVLALKARKKQSRE